jgi:gamma-glutamyltranspeptidase/glutathione hydrolase
VPGVENVIERMHDAIRLRTRALRNAMRLARACDLSAQNDPPLLVQTVTRTFRISPHASGRTRRTAMSLLVLLSACTGIAPAPPQGPDVGKRAVGDRGMVAAGNAYASEAGLAMLQQGGNAIDAAVATAFVLGVAEPMMSGAGAGGGLLYWDAKAGRAEYLDFYSASGSVPDTGLRTAGGSSATPRGVGIPGAVRGLLGAHARFGRLPRATVLGPAIRLAADGITVNALLAREIASSTEKLATSPAARELFLPAGKPLRAGDHLVQAELAATLRRIAAEGPDVFYSGAIGDDIVKTLRAGGSTITRADFAAYQPKWTRPVCTTYHGRVVLSAAAPQSGVQVVEALNLLADRGLPALGLPSRSAAAFRVMTGAMRIAVTDRDAAIGDPSKVGVPMAGLTSAAFASTRSALVEAPVTGRLGAGDAWPFDATPTGDCAAMASAPAATPAMRPTTAGAPGDGSMAETTHMSVVDADGNAVSVTNTLGLAFGTGTWVDGVFLNSAMFNFARDAAAPNAAGPFKVPASTIAPTIVLRDGRVEIVVGCPGSPAIPPAIVATIVYLLDYGFDPLQALRMPRMIPASSTQLRMEDGFAESVYAEARRLGYEVTVAPPVDMGFGGVSVIQRVGSHWVGATDPRRDGEVRGW